MQTVLTINAGSSSLKATLFLTGPVQEQPIVQIKLGNLLGNTRLSIKDTDGSTLVEDHIDLNCDEDERHHSALDFVLNWIAENRSQYHITAFGHRIVHGGKHFLTPTLLDQKSVEHLKTLIPLAPLHQPYNTLLIDCCHELMPSLPQIGCFDTMFHASQSDLERHYALPRELTEAGIQRYGFHGLSYEYIVYRLGQIRPRAEKRKTVICHLGAGASMCAVKEGKSVASSMGFTAVDGLPMGSRCGSIDPGVILYLERNYQMTPDQIEHLIYKESGWLGVSGESSDMIRLKRSNSPEAQEAIAMFAYRIALELGRLTAALGGLEQLIFTGGVGENDAELRATVCEQSAWLGIQLDTEANRSSALNINSENSSVDVWVIPTNEEAMIAHHVTEVIGA
jgi:acetate kinase